jgi:hypothetical protein
MTMKSADPTTRGDEHVDWHTTWPGRVEPPIDHAWSYQLMCKLSQQAHRWFFKRELPVEPQQVIDVLNKADVSFVLMGKYGLIGWMADARSTLDVDVLVHKDHYHKAIEAIAAAFPELRVVDTPAMTRFVHPELDRAVLDLMKPTHPLLEEVFKQTLTVDSSHRIPQLEAALACKFAAMVCSRREMITQQRHAVDFAMIVDRNKDQLHREKLRTLGDLVYPDGGKEMLGYVDDAIAGRQLIL